MKDVILLVIGFTVVFLLDWTMPKEVRVGPCVLVEEEPHDCPDPDYIQVYLFTRKNKKGGQYISLTETTDNMTSSYFNASHPNKLIIHGYNSDMSMYALMDIKAEYLRHGDCNVWMVNYPRLAQGSSLCYPFAVHNIRHVGHCLVQLVMALRRHESADPHVVGFSLGAHVPNYIAEKLGSRKLDRITGLDPAGPLFTARSEIHRLDPSDANFVDVVHTNGLIQGIIERCGHVDFYMNGGVSQPGCLNDSNPISCDHHRAPEYFAESIRTKVGFLGWRCESYVHYLMGECKPNMQLAPMGEHCPSRNATGFYITYTASEKPFALGLWTGEQFQKRAPKMGFTKMPRNSATEIFTNQQSELLQRIFPSAKVSQEKRSVSMQFPKMQKHSTTKTSAHKQTDLLEKMSPSVEVTHEQGSPKIRVIKTTKTNADQRSDLLRRMFPNVQIVL